MYERVKTSGPRYIEYIQISFTAQKMKFSIEDLFSKCDQIRSFRRFLSVLFLFLFFLQWLVSFRIIEILALNVFI